MTTLTLLTKTTSGHQIREIEEFLQDSFEDLDVQAKISGNIDGWVQVSVSGEDEEVAKNFIAKEIGLAPATIEAVTVGMELKGFAKKSRKPDFLAVDIGVTQPKIYQANLSHLQASLAGGKKLALEKIVELYGLREGVPVNVRVLGVDAADGIVSVELSAFQIEKFKFWTDSLLDRLIVLGVPKSKVEEVLGRARLTRDIIGVESAGLFEHFFICKLGTDAAGIIPRVGGYLKWAKFVVFNPRKIRQFLS